MLILQCPNCGARHEEELRYGGEATSERPRDPQLASDAAWTDYLFGRRNPEGWVLEWWLCFAGCQRWFLARRNTRSDEVDSLSESWAAAAGTNLARSA